MKICFWAITFSLTMFLVGCKEAPVKLDPIKVSEKDRDVGEFLPMTVIPEAFPAIVTPEVSDFESADAEIKADELVLGVEIEGDARAYPINMLTMPQREIFNDKLGGRNIAATW